MSEVGLERLAERNGFDCLKEDYIGGDGHKMKTLVIAGSSTQLDIVLDHDIVQAVTLAFPGLSEPTAKLMEPAGQILLQDLKLLPNQSPLTKTLDGFAANLERLASLDQLSIVDAGFTCHEALAGIYTSLERVYQCDVEKLRAQPAMNGKSDQYLSLMAMCTRHGLPIMHAQGRVGLALQYWKEKRFLPPSNDQVLALVRKHEKVWSLAVECRAMHHIVLPPVRVSDSWISKDIVKDDGMGSDAQDLPLDWQDPEHAALAAQEEGKTGKGLDMLQPDLSTRKVPPVKFNVTFDPPVVVTHADWLRLHDCVEVEVQPPMIFPPTFDVMLFPIQPGAHHNPSELRTIARQRRVKVFDQAGNASEVCHRNTLFNYKRIYAMSVSELSFSHPKQLIAMLPILRQYAFISILLQNSFGPGTEDAAATKLSGKKNGPQPEVAAQTVTEKDELADFLKPAGKGKGSGAESTTTTPPLPQMKEMSMDVSLWVHPNPHLKVVFPFQDCTANIEMLILPNGLVDIINENILEKVEGSKEKGKKLTRRDLAEVLEHLEDLCKWAEWIRTRLS